MKIIVIGSGIAGLHFSLKAVSQGHTVTIVTKKKILESATNYAQGGIAAVLDQTDNFQKHIEDTLKAGSYHNKKSAVALIIKNAPRLIHELIELGVPFATHEGKLLLAREGGHSKRRVAFVGDYTGQEIERALIKKVREEKNIEILEHTFAIDLLVYGGICFGVQVFSQGKIKNLFSDRVVLATGGLGQIFKHTTNPEISTGDGYAMGVRAGVPARDMEFIQFHPTAFRMRSGRLFLLTETLRGEGAYLRNEKGVRFMKKRHPLAELAPRDIVARAIFEECKRGKVFLDFRHVKEDFLHSRFPTITAMLRENGYRIPQDLIPVFPAAHYCCGGLVTDLKGRTRIKNLYAFGEVAWTGVHGANRLASNSLLEALVFSDQILREQKSPRKGRMPRFTIPPVMKSPSLEKIKTRLRRVLWENIGIIRTEKGLTEAIATLEELHREILSILERGFSPTALEARNMIETGLIVAKVALKRKKSLGCHYRDH